MTTIRPPGPRLLRSIPFSFQSADARARRKVDAPITLIPFIDFLLTVVVFLLMSFSASGELVTPAGLPSALNGAELDRGPIITIDEDRVTIDGRHVAQTRDLLEGSGLERVEPLVRDLEIQRQNYDLLHPSDRGTVRPILVLASGGVDYRAIRKVLFSSAQAGFEGAELAVRQR